MEADQGPSTDLANVNEAYRLMVMMANAYADALQHIAAPMRPDGTWNIGRERCQQIAETALRYDPMVEPGREQA